MTNQDIDLGSVADFFVAHKKATTLDAKDALHQLLEGADTAISCAMHGVSDDGKKLTITIGFLLRVLTMAQSQVQLAQTAMRSINHVAAPTPVMQANTQSDLVNIYDQVSDDFDECFALAGSLEDFIEGDNDIHEIGLVAKNLREKLHSLTVCYFSKMEQLKNPPVVNSKQGDK